MGDQLLKSGAISELNPIRVCIKFGVCVSLHSRIFEMSPLASNNEKTHHLWWISVLCVRNHGHLWRQTNAHIRNCTQNDGNGNEEKEIFRRVYRQFEYTHGQPATVQCVLYWHSRFGFSSSHSLFCFVLYKQHQFEATKKSIKFQNIILKGQVVESLLIHMLLISL